MFYFAFLQSNTLLLANQNILTNYNVTIATINYPIITTDANRFQTTFNQTSKTLSSLQGMGCLICNYSGNPDYSAFVYSNSPVWSGFLAASLISFIAIIVIKMWQIYNFDIIRAIYNREHAKADFNITNWIVFNLMYCCLIFGHYYFFNFVFTGYTEPCVGGLNFYASTDAFFNNTAKVIYC